MSLPTMWMEGALRRPRSKQKPIDALVDAVRAAESGRTPGEKFVVLRGETGSGKSMLGPPRLLKLAADTRQGGPGVVCAQPRVLTAVQIARDVGAYETYGAVLGENLGWLTGKSAKIPRAKTSLLYATVGSVASALAGAETFREFANRWRYVVLDEVHERSLEQDLLLRSLLEKIRENAAETWCPVVVLMSATIDPDEFARYVGTKHILVASGRAHPIKENWPAETPSGDYVEVCAETAVRVHKKLGKASGDIMVFLPALAEHKNCSKFLAGLNDPKNPYLILSIMGPTVAENGRDYVLLGETLPNSPVGADQFSEDSGVTSLLTPVRRIIIASTVAETGLTLPELVAVVDSGWTRRVIFVDIMDTSILMSVPASRREIRQRMGRAGRVAPGNFYPTYTKATFDALDEAPPPPITNMNPARALAYMLPEPLAADTTLKEARAAAVSPGDLNLLTPIPPELTQSGLEKLFALGFAKPLAGAPPKWTLTRLGALVNNACRVIPVELVSCALFAGMWGCSVSDIVLAFAAVEVDLDILLPEGRLSTLPRVVLSAAGEMSGDRLESARAIIADQNCERVLFMRAVIAEAVQRTEENPIDRVRAVVARKVSEHIPRDINKIQTQVRNCLQLREHYTNVLTANGIPAHMPASPGMLHNCGKLSEFLRELVAFKRALADGLKCNTCTREGARYKTCRGLYVNSPKLPEGFRSLPRELCYITLTQDTDAKSLTMVPSGWSVLDGYVLGGAAAGAPLPEVHAHARAPADAVALAAAIGDYVSAGRMLNEHTVPVVELDETFLEDKKLPQASASGGFDTCVRGIPAHCRDYV